MAASFVGTGVAGGNKTSASTIVVTLPTAGQAVDDVVCVLIGMDDVNTSGTSFVSVGQPSSGAITWETRRSSLWSPGAAGDGLELLCLSGKVTTAITGGASVTVTLTGTCLAKAWRTFVVRGVDPAISGFRYGAGSGGVHSVVPAQEPRAFAAGDLVVGVVAVESATSITTADTDTTSGSWATALTATSGGSGGDATKMSLGYQTKLLTGAGAQTWNANTTVVDAASAGWTYFAVAEGPPAKSYALTATGGGVATVARTSARSRSQVLTGGGVATLVRIRRSSTSLSFTGGGVATTSGVVAFPELHSGSLSATGGGVVSVAGIRRAVRSLALTGGGVVVLGAPVKRALRSQVFTGGGVLTQAVTSARVRTLNLSGGGVVYVSYALAAQEQKSGTVAATGGGSVVIARIARRRRALAVTGGGVVRPVASKGALLTVQVPSGLLAETGDGLLTEAGGVLIFDAAVLGAVFTGGGVSALASRRGAVRSLALSGGGVLVPVAGSARARAIGVTGGGVLALAYAKTVAEERAASLMLTGGGVMTLSGVKLETVNLRRSFSIFV